ELRRDLVAKGCRRGERDNPPPNAPPVVGLYPAFTWRGPAPAATGLSAPLSSPSPPPPAPTPPRSTPAAPPPPPSPPPPLPAAAVVRPGRRAARPAAVYPLAALTHGGGAWDAPEPVSRVNALGALNVLRACADPGVGRVLAAGSADVYGAVAEEDLPLTE